MWGGCRGTGSGGPVTDSVRFFKKGNCITLIEELLRMVKAPAFGVQASFTHQCSLCLLHNRVFSADYMFPLNVRKKDESRHPQTGRPPFGLRVDVLS